MLRTLLEVAMSKTCKLMHIVEKMKFVVARSTVGYANAKKHNMFGPHLDVKMLKIITLLWRETNFQVKMPKWQHVRSTALDAEASFCVAGAIDSLPRQSGAK